MHLQQCCKNTYFNLFHNYIVLRETNICFCCALSIMVLLLLVDVNELFRILCGAGFLVWRTYGHACLVDISLNFVGPSNGFSWHSIFADENSIPYHTIFMYYKLDDGTASRIETAKSYNIREYTTCTSRNSFGWKTQGPRDRMAMRHDGWQPQVSVLPKADRGYPSYFSTLTYICNILLFCIVEYIQVMYIYCSANYLSSK